MQQRDLGIDYHTLDYLGLGRHRLIRWNLSTTALVQLALTRGEGTLVGDGALRTTTLPHTGRCPKDRFIVDEPGVRGGVFKADTHAGGRGKGGGVKFVKDGASAAGSVSSAGGSSSPSSPNRPSPGPCSSRPATPRATATSTTSRVGTSQRRSLSAKRAGAVPAGGVSRALGGR